MFKNVVIQLPDDQATRNTKFVAMLQCNRGYTHRIAVGASKREALDKLNRAKAENVLAVL